MKKAIPALLLLFVTLGIGAYIMFRQTVGWRPRATELLPAETVSMFHLPNITRTALRLSQTEMAKIGDEPEMRAFLEKMKSQPDGAWREWSDRLVRIIPRETFVAMTQFDTKQPKLIFGLNFAGSAEDVRALVAPLKAALKEKEPTGKTDLTTHANAEIETFTTATYTLAETFSGGWYFLTSDLALLRSTLDRLNQSSSVGTLATAAEFSKSAAQLPAESDAHFFLHLEPMMKQLTTLLEASGQTLDDKQRAEFNRMTTFSAAGKVDGSLMRDVYFLGVKNAVAATPMPLETLALADAATVFYSASAVKWEAVQIPAQYEGLLMFVPQYFQAQGALARRGLKWSDAQRAFGREAALAATWPAEGMPDGFIALTVGDKKVALDYCRALLDVAALPMVESQVDGATLLTLGGEQLLPGVEPTLAVGEKFAVLGVSKAAITATLARAKTPGGLAAQPAFAAAKQSVKAPTESFSYLDLPTIFERGYGQVRPLLGMSLALNQEAGKYIDAGKMPSAQTISRHLVATASSQYATADGNVSESAGSLTMPQAMIGSVALGAVSFGSTIASALKGLDPSAMGNLLPGFADPIKIDPQPPAPTEPKPAEPENEQN